MNAIADIHMNAIADIHVHVYAIAVFESL